MKKRLFLPLLFLFIIFLVLLLRQPETNSIKEGRYLLGTPCEIELVGNTKQNKKLMKEAFALIKEYDAKLSNYKEKSLISRVNLLGGDQPIKLDQETYDLIRLSLEYSKTSDGLFDITTFPLTQLWGFFGEEMEIPSQKEIDLTLAKVGSEKVELFHDGTDAFINFKKKGVTIDLGGIGKGFICDQVAGFLLKSGQKDFLVNIGGNLYASGKSPSGDGWRIAIRNPRDADIFIDTIAIENKAVSTSGDYERYFIKDEKRYSHILNPNTGLPTQDVVSVTVLTDSAMHADAASTILFLADKKKLDVLFHRLKLEKAYIVRENKERELETVVLSR